MPDQPINNLMSNVIGSDFSGAVAGRADFFPKLPTHVAVVAVSTSPATWTVPTGTKFVVFSPYGSFNFLVRPDAAAAIPVGAVTDGTGSFANPAQNDVRGVTSIGIIADSTGYLTIACYG